MNAKCISLQRNLFSSIQMYVQSPFHHKYCFKAALQWIVPHNPPERAKGDSGE